MGLLPFQKEDFKGTLKAMEGKPVTIRLLDPPLHEFITLNYKQINELAENFGIALPINNLCTAVAADVGERTELSLTVPGYDDRLIDNIKGEVIPCIGDFFRPPDHQPFL